MYYTFTRALFLICFVHEKFSFRSHKKKTVASPKALAAKKWTLTHWIFFSCIWYAIYRTADTHSINNDRNRYKNKWLLSFLFSSLEILCVIRCYRLSVINIIARTFKVKYRIIFWVRVSVHVWNFILFFWLWTIEHFFLLLLSFVHEFGDTNFIVYCFAIELLIGFNKITFIPHA